MRRSLRLAARSAVIATCLLLGSGRATWAAVDGALGTYQDAIPIGVPGFREIAPQLSLSYDSSGKNGWTGVGWNLSGVGRIERASPGRGAPNYDANDIFVLDGLIDGDALVPCQVGSVSPSCTTGGTHSTKAESYARIAYSGTGASSRWTFVGKDGTKAVYAPIYSPATDVVLKWGLSTVTGTKNNVVTYNWAAGQDRLDSITYNGNTIKFYYEARTDVETSAVGAGYALASMSTRLKTIEVLVGSSRLRAYKLTYTTSGSTARSLLGSVQQFGKDAVLDGSGTVTGGTSLPAITAGYQAGSGALTAGSTDTAMASNTNSRYFAVDINGDRKTDMLELFPNGASYSRKTWISSGTGFTLASNDATGIAMNTESKFITLDVNGDGKSDLIELLPNGANWTRNIWTSNGTGFALTKTDAIASVSGQQFFAMDINADGKDDLVGVWPNGTTTTRQIWLSAGTSFTAGATDSGMGSYSGQQFIPMDVNGDGKTDMVTVWPNVWWNGSNTARQVWLSNGAGFIPPAVTDGGQGNYAGQQYYAMDVNGDGKQDMVVVWANYWWNGSNTARAVWLSTGTTFTAGVTDGGMANNAGQQYYPMDVNGDGRTDMVATWPSGGSMARQVWLANGTSFAAGASDVAMTNSGQQFFPMDVNGDGMTDFVELKTTGATMTRNAWVFGGTFPDLLSTRTTGLGGTMAVAYTPSTTWLNSNSSAVRQTVAQVGISDGRNPFAITSYAYGGGLYDWAERRFLGYRNQVETKPCIGSETACPRIEREFRQDVAAARMPSVVVYRSGDGTPLAATGYEYTTNGTTLPYTALPTGRWDYVYRNTGAACPGVDCKRTYVGRTFNGYGEVTQEVDYGDMDVTGDETTTTTVYVPNTTAYIVGLPADVKIFQGVGTGGALLNEELSYYDGAASWNQAPTAGLETKVGRWLSSPSSFVTTSSEYDSFGNLTAMVDALGARTTLAYDPTYRLYPTSSTNALTQTVTTAWDYVCAMPTQFTNINAQTTTMTYDALCRVATKSAPGGKTEVHSWGNLGNAQTQYLQIDRPSADGAVALTSRSYFDGLSRNWRMLSRGPNTATGDIFADTAYDARGNVAMRSLPFYYASGVPVYYVMSYGFDALDRPTTVTNPDGTSTVRSYNLWSITDTDELGRSKTDRFNADGQRIAHDETVGGVVKTTSYVYDARQNLQQTTDPAGTVSTQTTDSLGRVTQVTDPDWGTSTYEYDGAGRLTATVDSKSQRTTFGYDALARKTSKTTKAGTAQAETVSWTYDQARAGFYNVGALTTITDGAGTKTFDYDVAGRATKIVRTISGRSYTFQHGYDAGDRLLWTTYPDGDTLGTPAAPLTYDAAGRLKSIPGYVTSASYNAEGSLIQYTNANGTSTTRTHSAQRSYITGITTTSGATTIQNLAYTRNAKGFVTGLTSPITNEAWTYTKDELDRLTVATNTTSATYNQTLAYDAIGNITSNSTLGAYTYHATKKHAVTAAGGNTYAYDAAGLMTSGAGRTLTWDGANRLATVTSAGVTTTMTYDADDARIQQVEGTAVTHYLGDDYEVDVTLGTVSKYITLAGIPVARKDGTTKTWIHTDQLGSIQAETNAAGAEVHRKKYRPFGDVISSTGTVVDEPRGYTGQRHDGSGLVYLHARFYDPKLGRFISPDRILDSGDTIGLNRYAYTWNNPVDGTDVTGFSSNLGKATPKTKAPSSNNSKGQSNNASLNAAKKVSGGGAGSAANANRSSTLAAVKTTPGAARTTQIQSTRNDVGGITLSTQYSSHYFAPPPPPPPAPVQSRPVYNASSAASGGSYFTYSTAAATAVPVASPTPWFDPAAVLAGAYSGVAEPERWAADGTAPARSSAADWTNKLTKGIGMATFLVGRGNPLGQLANMGKTLATDGMPNLQPYGLHQQRLPGGPNNFGQ